MESQKNVNVKKSNNGKSSVKYKKYVSFNRRIIRRVILIILFLILGIVSIFLSIKVNVYKNLLYYQNNKVGYNISLKNNKYYSSKTLDQDMVYIASLLNTINIDFNYNFRTSEKTNYKYDYKIQADVQVYDDVSGNTIFSKKEDLSSGNETIMNDSDSFEIKKNVNIGYEKYNEIAKKFISDYSIYAKSRLVVTFVSTVNDNNEDEYKKLNVQNNMKVVIPLNEQMVSVKLDYKDTVNNDKVRTYTKLEMKNKKLFYAGIVFIFLMFITIISLLVLLRKIVFKKKTRYDKELGRLLREYDRVIVEVKRAVETSDFEIIDVNSFNELLDVRDSLDKPVLFKEIHKGEKSEFLVRTEKEVYRYYLKAVDLEDN